MTREGDDLELSVVVGVVSGRDAVRRCLSALLPQLDPVRGEVIVPYDRWARDVGELSAEYPTVRFHFIEDLGAAASDGVPARTHGLYDRRRAVGLGLARGRLVAMIADNMIPAADWCRQITAAHAQPYAVIGGAIDNGVDRPINWALYYCDFGRYGRPLSAGEVEYASNVNIAYKRRALESIRDVWRHAYRETTVHWTLRARGEALFLDPRIVVYQHSSAVALAHALRERIEFGRVFAETRVAATTLPRRFLFALGTPLLPALLLARLVRHMRRQRRTVSQMVRILPIALCLLTAWALGELVAYAAGPPPDTPLSAAATAVK